MKLPSRLFILFFATHSLTAGEVDLSAILPPTLQKQLCSSLNIKGSKLGEEASLESIRGGSQTYRLHVGKESYLVRKWNASYPLEEYQRQLQCIELAAQAHITPSVVASFPSERCLVLKDAARESLFRQKNLSDHLVVQVAKVIKALHAVEGFPQNTAAEIEPTIQRRLRMLTHKQMDKVPELKAVQEKMQQVREEFSRQPVQSAACHNDLNPHRILVDASSVELFYWEKGGQADPWIDIATLLNFTILKKEQQQLFLQNCLDHMLTQAEERHLHLAQLLSLYQYGLYFLKMGCQEDLPCIAKELKIKTKEQFLQQMQEKGEVEIKSPGEYVLFARLIFKEIQKQLSL